VQEHGFALLQVSVALVRVVCFTHIAALLPSALIDQQIREDCPYRGVNFTQSSAGIAAAFAVRVRWQT
jgi:hypothetical protein